MAYNIETAKSQTEKAFYNKTHKIVDENPVFDFSRLTLYPVSYALPNEMNEVLSSQNFENLWR
jgi:hypothetical protein